MVLCFRWISCRKQQRSMKKISGLCSRSWTRGSTGCRGSSPIRGVWSSACTAWFQTLSISGRKNVWVLLLQYRKLKTWRISLGLHWTYLTGKVFFFCVCAGEASKCDAAWDAKQTLGERWKAEAAQSNRGGEQGFHSSWSSTAPEPASKTLQRRMSPTKEISLTFSSTCMFAFFTCM